MQTSLQRNAKKNVSELPSIAKLLTQAALYRVLKLQNVGAVYESLTLARTKKKRRGHLEHIDLYPQCPYSQNRQCITFENGVGTNTAVMIFCFLKKHFRRSKE